VVEIAKKQSPHNYHSVVNSADTWRLYYLPTTIYHLLFTDWTQHVRSVSYLPAL